ncbi:hypothetical protein SAMN04488548_11116 [Gordonia westfalica]|uniref:Uncharacterized protein n=1 Tax=Gordonia westfalica TaxID=158898 RepID=A0A1H2DPH8_9ACTN|nr:hypothetical protein SAMN04488548_11116 [Gordonia westfalica]
MLFIVRVGIVGQAVHDPVGYPQACPWAARGCSLESRPDDGQIDGSVADGFQAASSGGPWAGLWVTDWVMNSLADYPNPDYEKHSRFQFTGTLFVLRT